MNPYLVYCKIWLGSVPDMKPDTCFLTPAATNNRGSSASVSKCLWGNDEKSARRKKHIPSHRQSHHLQSTFPSLPPAAFSLPPTHSLPFSRNPPDTLWLSLLSPSPGCYTQLHTCSQFAHLLCSCRPTLSPVSTPRHQSCRFLTGSVPLTLGLVGEVVMRFGPLRSSHLYLFLLLIHLDLNLLLVHLPVLHLLDLFACLNCLPGIDSCLPHEPASLNSLFLGE